MIINYNGHSRVAREIESVIQQDPAQRGLVKWAVRDHLLPATRSLLKASHVLITTGFWIKSAGAIETDGPPGALVLTSVLEKMGKSVTLVSDEHCADVLERGLQWIGCEAELRLFSAGCSIATEDLIRPSTTHFIAIERPGRARDGQYYNFRGENISSWVAPMDDLLLACDARHIVTIGVGDGGNELGMGQVSHAVDTYVSPDRAFSSQLITDYCVCAGVSNWAAYAQAALLSHLVGRNLLPAPGCISSLLQELALAGAVDGMTGRCEPTVDGLDQGWELTIYRQMFGIASMQS